MNIKLTIIIILFFPFIGFSQNNIITDSIIEKLEYPIELDFNGDATILDTYVYRSHSSGEAIFSYIEVRNFYIVSTIEEFESLTKKYDSDYLKIQVKNLQINQKNYFKKYYFVIFPYITQPHQYSKNIYVKKLDNRYVLNVEIWERKVDVLPALNYTNLIIIQIPKKSNLITLDFVKNYIIIIVLFLLIIMCVLIKRRKCNFA